VVVVVVISGGGQLSAEGTTCKRNKPHKAVPINHPNHPLQSIHPFHPQEAQDLINSFLNTFPGVRRYIERCGGYC